VNQRQLIACIRNDPAPYVASDADLFAIVSAFDAAYGAYAEFQERMERYWACAGCARRTCVAWRPRSYAGRAAPVRDPVHHARAGLPELPRGQQLELDILGGDEIDLTLEARVHRVMDAAMAAEVEGLEEELIDEPTSVDRVEPSPGPETRRECSLIA